MASGVRGPDHAPMNSKRIAAAVLWFFAGWYAGAFIAYMLGVSDILGPILGITAAALFAGDPFDVIWKPSAQMREARERSQVRLRQLIAER